MSNFEAIGFAVATREDAAALARAPLKRAPGELRLHETGSVQVHRLEVGDGIELWSVRQGRRVVASYPTFLARGRRPAVVHELTYPHGPFTPRLWLEGDPPLALQLVNYLFVPSGALRPGVRVEVALSALVPGGLQRGEGELGLAPVVGGGDNQYRLVARVLAVEPLRNQATGAPLHWLRLDVGPVGLLEAVAPAALAEVTPGAVVTGEATLRGAVTEIAG